MRIRSGVTDKKIYFLAYNAFDRSSFETGLDTFTVYRSRNGGDEVAFSTPTVVEIDATNMPGVYTLTVDEDTTLDTGDDNQEMCIRITHEGMHPVTRVIEIYRPKITSGQTLTVSSGSANAAVQSIANGAITANAIASGALTAAKFAAGAFDAVWSVATRLLTAGTNIVLAKGTGVTGFNDVSEAQVNAQVDAALADYDGPTKTELDAAVADLATASALATVDGNVDAILVDTGTTLPATLSTIAGYVDTEVAAIKAKTDQLNFGVTGVVNANVTHVNETEVSGDGEPGTEWGPA